MKMLSSRSGALNLASRQRGMTFISLCLLAAVLVFAGYVVFKSVPVMTEYLAIKRVLKQASAGNTVLEIRQIYDRVASVEYLDQYSDPVSSKDLQVSKQNDQVVVNVDYVREIPLVGPAYLTYKLHASSK
ncbi:DUF4845 domain-containing protein [Allofranklinella schreckenbergeri]|uniref:DUF4845 domain-containing protein n=1 Tax=Allofranklinella schreckenbergeri TaxID=1076744 RepID=A0A3M6QDR4_9BURK|nr:DUF4845 domain-containing protein [Allofranklinella schreckenbergeri]RMW95986.1 DUF4845 domain-containing protein [Allofranklinella schreckenbergeri]RMX01266.1 DUF4845 domain-containing protein [Allofranklinella schreckenbergeri]